MNEIKVKINNTTIDVNRGITLEEFQLRQMVFIKN